MKTSITQIYIVCRLLPFAKVFCTEYPPPPPPRSGKDNFYVLYDIHDIPVGLVRWGFPFEQLIACMQYF